MVTTRSQSQSISNELTQSSANNMNKEEPSIPQSITTNTPSLLISSTEAHILTALAKEQVKNLPRFGGAPGEDVMLWLQQVEEVFNGAELQPTNKYTAVQSYLKDTALKWFRFNKSNIPDWSSFTTAIIKAYQPTLNETLVKLEKRYQLSDESVMEYHYDKLQLCLQADPNMSSSMIVHYLTKGLHDSLIPHVIRRHPTTPNDFLIIAQDEEKILNTVKGFSTGTSLDIHHYSSEDVYVPNTVGIVQHPITNDNNRLSHTPYYPPYPPPLMNIPTVPHQTSSTSSSRPSSSQQRPSSLSSRQCYSCYGFGHIAAHCPYRKNV